MSRHLRRACRSPGPLFCLHRRAKSEQRRRKGGGGGHISHHTKLSCTSNIIQRGLDVAAQAFMHCIMEIHIMDGIFMFCMLLLYFKVAIKQSGPYGNLNYLNDQINSKRKRKKHLSLHVDMVIDVYEFLNNCSH